MSQKRQRGVSATSNGVKLLRAAQSTPNGRLTYAVIAEKISISDKTVQRFFSGDVVDWAFALKIIEFLNLSDTDVLSSEDYLTLDVQVFKRLPYERD